MVTPVIQEISRKASELLSMASKEQAEMKGELSSARDEHKDTKKQIKGVQKAAEFIQKAVGLELSDVLKSKIDPKTLDTFCKALKTSSRVATQVVPTLRVLNNLSLAYDAAKVLYPEQAEEIENYITNAIQPDKNGVSQSFKSRLEQCKEDIKNNLDEYEGQQSKGQTTKTSDNIAEPKDDLPPSFKK